MALASALGAVPLEDCAERSWLEVEVSLDWKAHGATGGFEFGENKVAPFLFKADDVAEEPEVTVFLGAFGRKPRPARIRCEKLAVDGRGPRCSPGCRAAADVGAVPA